MKILLCISLILLALAIPSWGCSLSIQPLRGFDTTEFVFVGKIRGYTSPLTSTSLRTPAVGLIVSVSESVYLPRRPSQNFEVFPLGLYADCSYFGKTLKDLASQFPLNSELLVIAKEASLRGPLPNTANVRLEVRPGDLGGVVVNRSLSGGRLTGTSTPFDYRTSLKTTEDASFSERFLPNFEVRKDLYRLELAHSQAVRDEVLERLVFLPKDVEIDLHSVFVRYAANPSEANRFFEKFLKLTDPATLNLMVIKQWVFKQLAEQNIDAERAKKLFETALTEKMDEQKDGNSESMMLGLTREEMLKRCLAILKRTVAN